MLPIHHNDHRFESSEHAVGPPVSGEFRRGSGYGALVVAELGFEPFEEGEGVRSGPGESCYHFTVVQLANLFRIGFHHNVAEGNLTISADGSTAAGITHSEDGGGMNLRHRVILEPDERIPSWKVYEFRREIPNVNVISRLE